ncbi:PREDICTED: GPI mannosyltransferase 2 isoform X2 [Tarenaya hassleriana]|uniref:GPI mannosyltransferase 2 isoform X2 n=1 Tax=Tarenaya hassleriana TaxID=28532 RepID=UPI00053C7826|nr:PREDICTED: GPI mannosyltransferase 2 isoform X2 [Tarenaya hassleriana]
MAKKAIDPTSMTRNETLVLKYAVISRILVLGLTLLWRSFLEPYDTSAAVDPPCLRPNEIAGDYPPPKFAAAAKILENGIVWDSVYFVRIAQCGYEYEQTYAFLPLLPFCISVLSRSVFAPLVPVIGLRAVMALCGYVVSNLAFLLAAIYLFRLSVIILKDPEAALRASILFCFNPASIFYSSIYSESLYALFSIGGVYHLISGTSSIAVFWFALSGFARSNGVLNAGYICFRTMHRAYDALYMKRRIHVVITGFLQCVCICLPFVAFQAYGYYNICHGRNRDEVRPWCKARVPLLYNFIQSHYWGVGFLRYFQFKQLPNFLLASPILSLAVCSILSYVKSRPELFLSLGFQASNEEKRSTSRLFYLEDIAESEVTRSPGKTSSNMGNHDIRQRKPSRARDAPAEPKAPENFGFLSAAVFPFVVHLGLLTATAFFVMHVQVATRFLSASPPLYWFASYLMAAPKHRRWGYMIWTYCAAYILLGSLLFSNFYPFT